MKKVAALGLVGGLVAIVAVALVMFSGGFTSSTPVTITADRVGLVMEPDAKVKMLGVEIGRVASIEHAPDGARLELAMQPSMMALVPANARVEIKSTTVFGAKYVDFIVPTDPDGGHLQPGAVIPSDSVTVEFNTVFQHLSDVLAQIEPEKLNATLGAISSALQGRGDELGSVLEQTESYLAEMNPSLPQLQEDLVKAANVTNLYADTVPDLLHTVDNVTTTGNTVVEEQTNLDLLLLNVTGLANTSNQVLRDNEPNLVSALDLLTPTTGLLEEYAPQLSCFIVGLNNVRPLGEEIMGGGQPGIALSAGFFYGAEPYTYPRDLPKVNATGGPGCYGLPNPDPNVNAKFVVTDTGTVPYVPSTVMQPNMPKLFQLLFAGVYPEGGQ
ncbi:MCE family protein [Rhodococcus triatomae]|uniref:Phospholipid/cholesterol/gamma-HCH transport system substrate-binding protein n=1 Tax=Rhodococcus triatomae TaxID=300028 RepID=A0A1G8B927_9NOCA|nr:MCE family protein [Rhodococcus triatomae]QNG17529.1 MCE family protein [Rhodococcus triatomae]QNG22803.1 MCE family protein [Rhodococcus triatomae]SDH29706.1 phospholipid/cholesterol/gamma-HCH transport system substrate-binding protein [Rhodococcus triatomae]